MLAPRSLWMVFAAVALCCVAVPRVEAGDWGVVLNGRSVHVDADLDWNDNNWGLGVEREFDAYRPWVKVAVANGFEDSRYKMSYMAGAGIKRRRWFGGERLYADIGVVGFVMTRDDVHGGNPFLGALPTLSLGTRRVAMNVTYLPAAGVNHEVDPDLRGVLFFQFKLDASLFGFGGADGIRLADSRD